MRSAIRPLPLTSPRGDKHAPARKLTQERMQRQNPYRPVLKRTIAEVDAVAAGRDARAVQVRERPAVLRPPALTRLHLDPDCVPAAGPDEIHLRPRGRPIVRE